MLLSVNKKIIVRTRFFRTLYCNMINEIVSLILQHCSERGISLSLDQLIKRYNTKLGNLVLILLHIDFRYALLTELL
jgi:hypothetical protein